VVLTGHTNQAEEQALEQVQEQGNEAGGVGRTTSVSTTDKDERIRRRRKNETKELGARKRL